MNKFVYNDYSYEIKRDNLKIFFHFSIEPNINFYPEITIRKVNKKRLLSIGKNFIDNLIFNLGLAEIPTYWKATCSPEIVIRAGYLDSYQIKWWQNLILKGMGQFFYENKISFLMPGFKIESSIKNHAYRGPLDRQKTLVAVGGGKDSVVTLETLKKKGKQINCFSLNPTPAAKKIIRIAGCKQPIIVERKIDKKLLELNRKGYLNGHTPFSAYLAFLSVLLGAIFDYKYLAFSNEKSADEGNLKYLGKTINHQWSKGSEFEKLFGQYSKKYLVKNIEYFSFLRHLYEIQIAKLFSKHPKYFYAFMSCNEAFKTGSGTKKPIKKWCGKCPKCLFVFACLYPFLKEKELIKIFGKNLFDDKKLIPVMEKLIGQRGFKPFECVGTIKESLTAFYLSLKRAKKEKKTLPFLLAHLNY
ncbi:MAG: hypothetical protein HYW70_01310 [Candidatus Nealsonbacteria bacterium]|nr:hypothetical protein [Candidatus Nealsonbacteria bacterium]